MLSSAARMRTLLSPPACQTEMKMPLGPMALCGVLFPSAVATSCRVTRFIRPLPACCFSCALAIVASSDHLISCPCSSSAQKRLHLPATISSSTSSTPLSSLMTLWGLLCPDLSFLVTANTRPMSPFAAVSLASETRFSNHAVRCHARPLHGCPLDPQRQRCACLRTFFCRKRSLVASRTLCVCASGVQQCLSKRSLPLFVDSSTVSLAWELTSAHQNRKRHTGATCCAPC